MEPEIQKDPDSAVRREKTLHFTTAWTELEGIMFSESEEQILGDLTQYIKKQCRGLDNGQ